MKESILKALISSFIALVISNCLGFWIVTSNHFIQSSGLLLAIGLINSLFVIGVFSLFLFPFTFFKKQNKWLTFIIHFLLGFGILFELISFFYFTITLSLIDSSIFKFSMEQASLIVGSYFAFKWYYLFAPIGILSYFFCYNILKKRTINNKLIVLFYLVGIAAIFLQFQYSNPTINYQELGKNKVVYFIQSLNKQQNQNSNLTSEEILFYLKATNPKLTSLEFPLYHPTDTENPLEAYFNLKDTPPNIVLIVAESFSSSFSGPRADELSYTPFLDSLAEHSLYFDNSIATAERSFGALPGMIGSLPHGETGFMHSTTGYPSNQTLSTWLFDNGYSGDFYFGGWSRFSEMDLFMHNQQFDNIYDFDDLNDGYTGKGPEGGKHVDLGISDKLFFKQIDKKYNQKTRSHPFFDVYCTRSSHVPFEVENQSFYIDQVQKMVGKSKLSSKIKEKHLKYSKELSTFLYSDDALKLYFENQRNREEHQNTIYIIAGDHTMGEITQSNPMEKYRSIMMIYSPLLKSSKVIKAVNSHLDIAPSIYSLIQQKYNLKQLRNNAWLGRPFNMSSQFQADRYVLMMSVNLEYSDMLNNNYFYSGDKVYTVGDRLKITLIQNKELEKKLKQLYDASVKIHRYVVMNNKLVPSTVASQTITQFSKRIKIDKQNEFANIYTYDVNGKHSGFEFYCNLKVDGDWMSSKNDETNPLFVYTLNRGDSTLIWKTIDSKIIKQAIHSEQSLSFVIKNNLDFNLQQGDQISVYFWNHKQLDKSFNAGIKNFKVIATE